MKTNERHEYAYGRQSSFVIQNYPVSLPLPGKLRCGAHKGIPCGFDFLITHEQQTAIMFCIMSDEKKEIKPESFYFSSIPRSPWNTLSLCRDHEPSLMGMLDSKNKYLKCIFF